MSELLAQAVGFLGAALFALAFQCKSSRRMIVLQAVSGLVFAIHYLMPGGYTGCVMQLLFAANSHVPCTRERAWAAWGAGNGALPGLLWF